MWVLPAPRRFRRQSVYTKEKNFGIRWIRREVVPGMLRLTVIRPVSSMELNMIIIRILMRRRAEVVFAWMFWLEDQNSFMRKIFQFMMTLRYCIFLWTRRRTFMNSDGMEKI